MKTSQQLLSLKRKQKLPHRQTRVKTLTLTRNQTLNQVAVRLIRMLTINLRNQLSQQSKPHPLSQQTIKIQQTLIPIVQTLRLRMSRL